jgi:hypothetical protein
MTNAIFTYSHGGAFSAASPITPFPPISQHPGQEMGSLLPNAALHRIKPYSIPVSRCSLELRYVDWRLSYTVILSDDCKVDDEVEKGPTGSLQSI